MDRERREKLLALYDDSFDTLEPGSESSEIPMQPESVDPSELDYPIQERLDDINAIHSQGRKATPQIMDAEEEWKRRRSEQDRLENIDPEKLRKMQIELQKHWKRMGQPRKFEIG